MNRKYQFLQSEGGYLTCSFGSYDYSSEILLWKVRWLKYTHCWMLHIISTSFKILWLWPTVQWDTKGGITSPEHLLTWANLTKRDMEWKCRDPGQFTYITSSSCPVFQKKLDILLDLDATGSGLYYSRRHSKYFIFFTKYWRFFITLKFFVWTSTAGKFAICNLLYLKSKHSV